MKIRLLFGIFLIGLFLSSSCVKTSKNSVGDDVERFEEDILEKEDYKIEERGIIIDKFKFRDDKSTGEVIKNKLTKTATIRMSINVNDTEEYAEFFGEQISSVPFLVNTACSLFAVAFFDPDALAELQEGGNLTTETKEDSILEGYKVSESSIRFLDEENNKLIAECTATGSEWEDIKFNAYREYENSLFGMKIGEALEDE